MSIYGLRRLNTSKSVNMKLYMKLASTGRLLQVTDSCVKYMVVHDIGGFSVPLHFSLWISNEFL